MINQPNHGYPKRIYDHEQPNRDHDDYDWDDDSTRIIVILTIVIMNNITRL